MTLDFDEIKRVALGYERAEVSKNGSLELFRFTEEEQKFYENKGWTDGKPTSSAGIRLEFATDATKLALVCDIYRGSSRKFFAFDVFSDGVLLGSFGMKDTDYPVCDFKVETELPSGNKTVKMVFPWTTSPKIKKFELHGGTYVKPVAKKRKMIIYGDSITQGYDSLRPSGSYAERLADALDAEIVNKAIGGEFFDPALARFDGNFKSDYVFVAYGTNDWCAKGNEEFKNNCKGFLEAISARFGKAKIFVLAPIWRADFEECRPSGTFSEVREYILSVVASLPNAVGIDCFDFVPHERKYFSDGYLHPNDDGFRFYGDALVKEVKKYM